jgi:tetratricopeptide (TPR) repeat protein
MSYWPGRLRVILILLAIAAAILVPVLGSGYLDIRRAAMAHAQQDDAGAATYYRAAALKLPWRSDLWEQVAASYVRAGNQSAAVDIYQGRRHQGMLSEYGWEYLGAFYCVNGNCREALQVWMEGLRAHPSDTRLYGLISEGYGRLGDYSNQRAWLERWVATGRGTAPDYFGLGSLLLASDPSRARRELARAASMNVSYKSAVDTLNAALDLAAKEPDASRRLVALGRGLALVQDWSLAEQAFDDATRADSRNAEAWAWLGEARQQQLGKDGKPALDTALSLDPGSTLVHSLRGLYWKRQGQYAAALAEYQAAAKLEPKNPECQAALGEAYALKGDLISALAAYQQATALAPDNAIYWRLLALFSADNAVHVRDIGLPAAKKAANLAPDDADNLDALGWANSQAGLLYSAQEALNSALKIAPQSAAAHLHLAITYLRQGNQSFAQTELNRVVELDAKGSSGAYAAQLLSQYFP